MVGRVMRASCKSRHVGPFSIGIHRTGQFRCINCDAVLSGVEVFLDTSEHAADGNKRQRTVDASPSRDAIHQPIPIVECVAELSD